MKSSFLTLKSWRKYRNASGANVRKVKSEKLCAGVVEEPLFGNATVSTVMKSCISRSLSSYLKGI